MAVGGTSGPGGLSGPAAGGPLARAPGDWAICCSGGGIRSAAYCLGALQNLDLGGLLPRVKWILGVSGGSYIATSRALVAHHLPAGTSPPAYAPGTPEERNLRYDTRYIAPNGTTVLVGALSMLLGALGVLVIVAAPLYAATHAWGWLLRWQQILVPSGPRDLTAVVTGTGWWLWPAIAGGLTLAIFFWWWGTLEPGGRRPGGPLMWLNPDSRDRGADRARVVGWAALLTAGLALAMLAAPPVISWLARSTGPLGTIAHFLGFGAKPTWSWSAAAALFAAVAAVARYSRSGMARWTASTSAAKAGSAAAPGPFTYLAGQVRQVLMPWVASAVIVLTGAVLALLWVGDGARAGFSAGQLVPVAVALAVIVLARVAVNVNRLSLHDSYRWRLADAFAVTREAAEAAARPDRREEARELFAQAAATRLSDLTHGPGRPGGPAGPGHPGEPRDPGEPALVICGTANINAVREVPPGQGGFCVTFDSEYVSLHREKGLAAPEQARARTADYETLIGHRRSTLFDVSAISGAAVSPLMGSGTTQAYRILYTAANVRLGVWLPHPAVVRDAHRWIEKGREDSGSWWVRRPLLLLLWYWLPHQLWSRDPDRSAQREARLWAHVLRLKRAGKRSGALWYRAMQPTLGLLWSEAAGRLSYRATWMYVTDGGHYDNLGLVEALRRGASHIVVLDASGDKADTWFTLGGAIALARSDEGVEIELDPTTMCPAAEHLPAGQVARPWTHGRFRRLPNGNDGDGRDGDGGRRLPQEGEIWICKLGWWTGAPWDVLAYAARHKTYPCDSTLDQLYDSTEFGAYQVLGAATVLDAAAPPADPPAGQPAAPPRLPLTHPAVPAGDGLRPLLPR
jgi:hypothetical protein